MKKLLLLTFLSACTMYPKYERPELAMPSDWRISSSDVGDITNDAWWAKFEDPVLNGYIQEALANNQDLMMAINNVNIYMAQLQIAKSQLYPQINLGFDGSRQQISQTQDPFITAIDEFPSIGSVSNRFNTFSLLLNGSYYLDFWGKVRSMAASALAELLSSIQNRRTVVLTLVTAVASCYIDILQLDEQISITKATLNTREESYRIAKIRFELGLTSEIQVEQAESELEESAVILYQLKIALAQQEDLLISLLGKTSGEIQRGKTLSELILPVSVPTYLPSDLLNQRPDIMAAEDNLMAANANIGVARANFFPQINLAGSLGTGSSQLSDFFKSSSTIWDYGYTILQEIFTGGQLTGNLKQAQAQKEVLLHQYQSAIINAVKEVNDAMISHKIAVEQEKLQKDRVQTLAQYLHLAGLRYQDGLTDYLTFLDAERKFFSAELDYAESQGYSFLTLINIYKALGGGWVVEADKKRCPN